MAEWGNSSFDSTGFGGRMSNGSMNNSFSGGFSSFGNHDRAPSTPCHPVNVPAQLEIQKLPIDTQVNEIRQSFGRYGKIKRIILDHRFEEDRVFCFLDYSDNASCDHAIRIENGKQIGRHQIIVQRCSNTGSSDLPKKRQKTDSWGGDQNNGSSWGNDNKSNNNDWSTPSNNSSSDWGNSDNRSGGGRGRGGRSDRGSRSGGRGCHRCGEEGHFARECPQGGGSGRGGRGRGRGGRGGDRHGSGNSGGGWANDNKSGNSSWADGWGDSSKDNKSSATTDWGTPAPKTETKTTSSNDEWGSSNIKTESASSNVDWGSVLGSSSVTESTVKKEPNNNDDDGWN